jgi:hypothetical protein
MKTPLTTLTVAGLGLLSPLALAGTVAVDPPPAPVSDPFADARRPITNPTLFDTALPGTNIHPIIIYHRLPDYVNTTVGPVPLGGDVQVYALQFEIGINEQLSIVATKDGWVDFNPDFTPFWSNENGWANLAAGLKYAFILDRENAFALSGTATFELPTGNHDVFQGEGEGAVNLIANVLKMWGPAELAGSAGVSIPFTAQLSTTGFMSAHFSYEVTPWFIPLVEVNWFTVLDEGNGRPNFHNQAGGLVPVVATFEGSDLLNFGSQYGELHDLVTAAIGFRSRLSENVDLGFAYEMPLSEDNNSIWQDRFTLDLIWRF